MTLTFYVEIKKGQPFTINSRIYTPTRVRKIRIGWRVIAVKLKEFPRGTM